MSKVCEAPLCIALAVPGTDWCVVHREHIDPDMFRSVGLVGTLQAVTDRIARDADGQPVRFYPLSRWRHEDRKAIDAHKAGRA